ncbi:MAG: Chain length determinant protein [Mucilaginibacter sp.]|nr:Chain length determinant protein [Mucilaginibacter sp.]
MNQSDQQGPANNSGEISIQELFAKIRSSIKYIKSKWLVILIISTFGALLGLGYSIVNKPTYTAICTFVLEESKGGGGLGQYSGLASLAGIDIGGQGGGGIFQGDNILELYKSRTMIEKALLSYCNFNGKNELLINRFLDVYKLRDTLKENSQVSHIDFIGNPDNFNRRQDSIITALVDLFNAKVLDVSKPDKKLNIINVAVVTKDELFSKYFTDRLVQNVNDFYVQTKTKNAYQNVQILQRQVDSVKRILNYSITGVASAIDASPNANPQLSTLKVTSQKRQIDVQTNTAVYGQIMQNLELAKISLRQQMPLIQVIDKPVLPLHIKKTSKLIGIITGFIIGLFFTVGLLVAKKIVTML